jgi:hypothetical protein
MNRVYSISILALASALAACGDNGKPDPQTPPTATLVYTDPSGGKLRLIKEPGAPAASSITLALVVGASPLTGYSAGFNLPLDGSLTVEKFTPGTALNPGEPAAAAAAIPPSGPLARNLVTGLSQRATGTGAVATDATLAAGSVLYKITLKVADDAAAGVVFDGSAADFVLPSGGLRDRSGATVVAAKDVAIGKLAIVAQ